MHPQRYFFCISLIACFIVHFLPASHNTASSHLTMLLRQAVMVGAPRSYVPVLFPPHLKPRDIEDTNPLKKVLRNPKKMFVHYNPCTSQQPPHLFHTIHCLSLSEYGRVLLRKNQGHPPIGVGMLSDRILTGIASGSASPYFEHDKLFLERWHASRALFTIEQENRKLGKLLKYHYGSSDPANFYEERSPYSSFLRDLACRETPTKANIRKAIQLQRPEELATVFISKEILSKFTDFFNRYPLLNSQCIKFLGDRCLIGELPKISKITQ